MEEEKNFFEKMGGKTQAAPDLFWGILSMMIYIVAAILQQITGWFGWFLVAAGANTALLGIELLRFRLPRSSQHRSTRRIAFFMILVFLLVCHSSRWDYLWAESSAGAKQAADFLRRWFSADHESDQAQSSRGSMLERDWGNQAGFVQVLFPELWRRGDGYAQQGIPAS